MHTNRIEAYLQTLRRILFLSNLAIRAPVAVLYVGGGVYLGGASSITREWPATPSRLIVVLGTVALSISLRALLFLLCRRSALGWG